MSTVTTFKPGVATGDEVQEIFKHAKKHNYALPAVNVVSTGSVNSVIETAKDKALFRKIAFQPRRRSGSDLALAVVDLIAPGQLHEFLCIKRLLVRWHHAMIHQNVVHESSTHGAGITEVAHL